MKRTVLLLFVIIVMSASMKAYPPILIGVQQTDREPIPIDLKFEIESSIDMKFGEMITFYVGRMRTDDYIVIDRDLVMRTGSQGLKYLKKISPIRLGTIVGFQVKVRVMGIDPRKSALDENFDKVDKQGAMDNLVLKRGIYEYDKKYDVRSKSIREILKLPGGALFLQHVSMLLDESEMMRDAVRRHCYNGYSHKSVILADDYWLSSCSNDRKYVSLSLSESYEWIYYDLVEVIGRKMKK